MHTVRLKLRFMAVITNLQFAASSGGINGLDSAFII